MELKLDEKTRIKFLNGVKLFQNNQIREKIIKDYGEEITDYLMKKFKEAEQLLVNNLSVDVETLLEIAGTGVLYDDRNKEEKQEEMELEDYLLRWVMQNGSPFTRITYSANDGLKIDNDNQSETIYWNTFQSFDKPLFDDKGNLIGIETVSYKKVKVGLSADDIECIVYGMEGESVRYDNKDFVALEGVLKILARYGIKLDE